MEAWREELYHHGIQGQKWGKRNGPPYPLSPNKYSNSEKASSSVDGKAYASRALSKIGNQKVDGMDPVTAMYLAQAAISVAIIVGAKVKAESNYKKDVDNNIKNNNTNIQKKIKGPHSEDKDMEKINPDYKNPDDISARMNCTMCSAAYELRRRGYDVVANKTSQGRKDKDYASWFNVDIKTAPHFRAYDKFAEALLTEPEGSRGFLAVGCGTFDSGHCMIWEKKSGNIIVRDCQSNTQYNSLGESCVNKNSSITYRYFRTDNADINWDKIRDGVVERG